MDKLSEFWSVNEGTFYCLFDRRRTDAFRRAIRATVEPGDVVVEMGAGSGVLSMFAADAGAARVYAVELDDTNVASLRATLATNGYDDRIVVVHDDATSVTLPERADVIICEMIATGLLEELQIPAMNNALANARPDPKVVLQEYHVSVDLVNHRNTYHDKRFDIIRYEFPDKPSLRSQVLSDAALVAEVDFRRPQRSAQVKAAPVLTITADGEINGLRLSAQTVFCDGSDFGFSISYSFPVILPIAPRPVRAGEAFVAEISYSMCEGPDRLSYEVSPTS